MKKKSIIILFVIFSLTGCMEFIKPIKMNITSEQSKIVVHGFISINDGVLVQINKTISPENINQDNTIQNVKAYLLIGKDSIVNLLKIGKDFFASPSNFYARTGVAYQIKVEASNFESVISNEQYIPATVSIDSLILDTTTFCDGMIYFRDPVETVNYYTKNYLIFYKGDTLQNFFTAFNEYFSPYELYEDVEFNGKVKYLEQQVNTPEWEDSLILEFRLYNISPDLALFFKSIQDYEFTRDDVLYDQQSPIYTNIKNGYGIFASYSYDMIKTPYINDVIPW